MRSRMVLVSIFIVAACRRAPPPSGSTVVPISSAPRDSGAADVSLDVSAQPGCSDSNECGPTALCCMTERELPADPGSTNPFYPVRTERQNICTATPEKDCDGQELCKGTSCRRPTPKVQLRCGALTCKDATPRCILDLAESAPGEKARLPMCVSDDPDAGTLSSELSCLTTEDCPRGAHCSLAYLPFGESRIDGRCAFKPRQLAHGRTTGPICREQAECTKLASLYGMTDTTKPSRCRPLRILPTIRVCEAPGNEQLF